MLVAGYHAKRSALTGDMSERASGINLDSPEIRTLDTPDHDLYSRAVSFPFFGPVYSLDRAEHLLSISIGSGKDLPWIASIFYED
jgi:hypothetical protein